MNETFPTIARPNPLDSIKFADNYDSILTSISGLFPGLDITQLEVGAKRTVSYINTVNGHAHIFAIEKSLNGKLLITIKDDESNLYPNNEGSSRAEHQEKNQFGGILIVNPDTRRFLRSGPGDTNILITTVTSTHYSNSWILNTDLTPDQRRALPKNLKAKL